MLGRQLAGMHNGEEIEVFIEVDPLTFEEFAKTHTLEVKRSFGSLYQIRITKSDLLALDELEGLGNIEFYWMKGQAMTDTMLVNNRVTSVHNGGNPLPTPYTGKDVVVGVVDAGMDVYHGDFRDSTGNARVLELWDQLAGLKWDSADINNRTCTHQGQLSWFGHGSQVAGIAAGNGLAVGKYRGVAPEADIVAVNSDFNATNWLGTVVDAFDYIYKHADTLGKPVVINASIGTYEGSHDGLDIPALMIDTMIKAKKGRALVAAAGNAGTVPFHLRYTLSSDTNFTWFKYNASTTMVFWEMWADSLDFVNAHFAFGADQVSPVFKFRGATAFDQINNRLNQTITDSIMSGSNVLAYVQTYAEYVRGRYRMQVTMNNPDSSGYYFRFMTTGLGKFDVWSPYWGGTSEMVTTGLPSAGVFPDIQYYKRPDTLQTIVSSFQCLESVLTVANYTNTDAYWDYDTVLQVSTEVRGQIASTSSFGPSRRGFRKPDLAASGNNTMAACDSFIVALALANSQQYNIGIGGAHKKNGGTSMASPVVAGTAALMLQRCPTMGWKELHDAIVTTTYTDTFTGTVPNNRWGDGKLDAMAAISTTVRDFTIQPGSGNICAGDSVHVRGPSGFTGFQWSSGSIALDFYQDSTGMFSAFADDTSGCRQASDTIALTLVPAAPKLTITQSNDTLMIPQGYAPYQWHLNGNPVGGQTSWFTVPSTNGNYHVTYVDSNGCPGVSDTISFVSSVGGYTAGVLTVFPNPTNANTTVEFDQSWSNKEVSVMLNNIDGSLVFSKELTVNGTQLSFNVSGVASGLYFLNIVGNGTRYQCTLSVVK